MISGYNQEAPPVRNLMQIVAQEIRLYGFLVFSLLPKHEEKFYAEVPALIARGELKWTEDRTIGLENADKAILAVQRGTNKAKSVVIVADEWYGWSDLDVKGKVNEVLWHREAISERNKCNSICVNQLKMNNLSVYGNDAPLMIALVVLIIQFTTVKDSDLSSWKMPLVHPFLYVQYIPDASKKSGHEDTRFGPCCGAVLNCRAEVTESHEWGESAVRFPSPAGETNTRETKVSSD
jgi:hypothetical protein